MKAVTKEVKGEIVKQVFLPTLFKKTSNGKIQTWKVSVEPARKKQNAIITVYYGVLNGKIQAHAETVSEGKNLGKKNATTPHQQARTEALAKWTKQLKLGYSKKKDEAEAGIKDKIITGGVDPMLAEKFFEKQKSVKFPVAMQPKLNGMRCLAIQDRNFEFTLWSRTRKPITSCPHIIEQLESMFKGYRTSPIDGELYVHDKMKFDKIISAVRKQKPSEESKQVEFHIYDLASEKTPYKERLETVNKLPQYYTHLKITPTCIVDDKKTLDKLFKHYIVANKFRGPYEGAMVRDLDAGYEHRRSNALLKMKVMLDEEFEIVDFVAGEQDSVVCRFKVPGVKVLGKATMNGDRKKNQQYIDDSWMYSGKKITVQFQEYSTKNKVPLFPVGIRVREDE